MADPKGRFVNYWHNYSFGDLSESAKTRNGRARIPPPAPHQNPRHVGPSPNIPHHPRRRSAPTKSTSAAATSSWNPTTNTSASSPTAQRNRRHRRNLFLPFEGDSTLSIILSKAFLLAEDQKIKDPTITRQIGGAHDRYRLPVTATYQPSSCSMIAMNSFRIPNMIPAIVMFVARQPLRFSKANIGVERTSAITVETSV